MYTDEGNKFIDRLWNETIAELDFPEVQEVLNPTVERSEA